MKDSALTTIILAGGKSRRMGTDKGLKPYRSQAMISHIISAASTLSDFLFISANSDDYKQFNYPVIKDIDPDKGPLSGLVSALAHSQTEHNLILCCDMPLLTTEALHYIVDQSHSNINVARTGQLIHPLVGVYSKSSLPQLKQALDQDRLSVKRVIAQLGCHYIDIPDKWFDQFKNFNFPDQLEE